MVDWRNGMYTSITMMLLDTVLYRLYNRHLSDLTAEERLQVVYAFQDCRIGCAEARVLMER